MSTKPQDDASYPVRKTDAEWRSQLDPMQYQVARHAATERPFTGKYWDHFQAGRYDCIGCGTPLFQSAAKFDAGCGWPSYAEPINSDVIEQRARHQPRHVAHRGALPQLRLASRPCVRRRPGAHRRALLHQFGRDKLRASGLTLAGAFSALGLPTERMKLLFDFLPIFLFFAAFKYAEATRTGPRPLPAASSASSSPAAWSARKKRRCCWPPWW